MAGIIGTIPSGMCPTRLQPAQPWKYLLQAPLCSCLGSAPAVFQATALELDQGVGNRPEPLGPSALHGAPRGRAGVGTKEHPWVPLWSL